MTTPTHMLMSAALFTKKNDGSKYYMMAVLAGLIPDVMLFVFYFVEKVILKNSEEVIWMESYYDERWQFIINLFNSIPIVLVVIGIGFYLYKKNRGRLFLIAGFGILLHLIFDFFFHHNDGHAHFFPFSNFVFQSPFSYWDVNHYGFPVSIFENSLILVSSLLIFKKIHTKRMKVIFSIVGSSILILGIMMSYNIYNHAYVLE